MSSNFDKITNQFSSLMPQEGKLFLPNISGKKKKKFNQINQLNIPIDYANKRYEPTNYELTNCTGITVQRDVAVQREYEL